MSKVHKQCDLLPPVMLCLATTDNLKAEAISPWLPSQNSRLYLHAELDKNCITRFACSSPTVESGVGFCNAGTVASSTRLFRSGSGGFCMCTAAMYICLYTAQGRPEKWIGGARCRHCRSKAGTCGCCRREARPPLCVWAISTASTASGSDVDGI